MTDYRRSEESARFGDEGTPSLMFEDDDGSRSERGRENPNVFADAFAAEEEEFGEEEFDGVVDGSRPGENHDREGRDLIRFDDDEDEQFAEGNGVSSSSSVRTATAATMSTRPSRNSTRKERNVSADNPFASPDDATVERSGSGTFAPGLAHRVSSASSRGYARTGSPRFGAGGSSHPYAMYTQTVPPSPSIRSSNGRPSRQSTIRNGGPQHPYAMYPQGVGEDLDGDDDDDDETAPRNPVPLGFLGINQTFRRNLGPDGEDQDIIGDYGHAEQLPPYTRYPEAGPEKMPLLAAPTALHSRAPVMGSDPGMPLMHQHLQPEPRPQSMTDQSALPQSDDARSSLLGPAASSASHVGSLETNKSWSEKSWREKRKTRVVGIPLWGYMLAFGVLSFIAIVLGGVIGGFVVGQEKQDSSSSQTTTITSLYDASFIAGAATATVPPTGSFKISLGAPQATQSACLPNVAQRPAWNCNLAGAAGLSIEVSATDNNVSGASIVYPQGETTDNLYYGSQASQMWTHYNPFMLVKDNEEPQDGPAYYFQQRYNKWVVVPENDLDPVNGKFKRDIDMPSSWSPNLDLKMANGGDKPWFCYWNSTLMEVFVYIQKPVTVTGYPSTSPTSNLVNTATLQTTTTTTPATTGASYPSSTTTSPSTTTSITSNLYATATTSPPYTSSSTPVSIVTSTVSMETATYSYTGPAAGYSAWFSSLVEPAFPSSSSSSEPYNRPRHRLRRDGRETYLIEDVIDKGPTYYPYLIKIEERRLPGSPTPYCTQYQILMNGSWNYAPNPNGTSDPWTIYLQENDPPYAVYQSEGIANRKRGAAAKRTPRPRPQNGAAGSSSAAAAAAAEASASADGSYEVPDDSVRGACHCQWMSGQS